MYAIIETGGKQYKVSAGDVIDIEKLALEEGDDVVFEKVLAVSSDEGLSLGVPVLENITVSGTVLSQKKAKKIIVFKYKPKKGYRRKQGHRQPFSKVKITAINT